VLDTNILVAYVPAGVLGEYVERRFHLRQATYKPLISVVSVGEIMALLRKFRWSTERIARMRELVRELIRIDISSDDVLEAYAELADFARTHETIPQNDIWIAATAKVTGATLLTTDKHFDQFHKTHLSRIWIDEEKVRRDGP
jgi:tRNA(fMet)-specific endonuclease VapC